MNFLFLVLKNISYIAKNVVMYILCIRLILILCGYVYQCIENKILEKQVHL
jgi:hypothetical protein